MTRINGLETGKVAGEPAWGNGYVRPGTRASARDRGLLTGTAIGDHAIVSIAWSIGISVAAYLWAIRLYNRRRAAEPK